MSVDRGLLGNVGDYIYKKIDKEKLSRPTMDLNEIIRMTCDDVFEKKLYEEFKKLHCSMKEWNSRAAIDGINEILKRLASHKELIKKILNDLENMEYTDFNVEFTKKKLGRRILALEKTIQDYKMSWLERSLTVNKVQIAPPVWIDMQNEDAAALAKGSLADALLVFSHPDYPRRLSLSDLIAVLELFGREGVDSSAGDELCKRICTEVCRRVTADIVTEFDPDIDYINEFYKKNSPECYVRLNSMIHINLEDKKSAFIKIYNAMRDGESSRNKEENFLTGRENHAGKEFIQDVLAISALHPDKRTAKAWSLTRAHYKECTLNNRGLLNSIYKWCFSHSGIFKRSLVMGMSLFRSSRVENLDLTLEQLHGGADDSRRGKIRRRIGML